MTALQNRAHALNLESGLKFISELIFPFGKCQEDAKHCARYLPNLKQLIFEVLNVNFDFKGFEI